MGKMRRMISAAMLFLFIGTALWTMSAGLTQDVYPSALFINVGKADCAALFVEGKTYLVDTGAKGSSEAMLRALDAYDVEYIDGVFITHTDKDHVGGLTALLQSDIVVERLYAPQLHKHDNIEKHPVNEASKEENIPLTWLAAGDVVTAGEGSVFTVLGPVSRDVENENNNSLVLHLRTPHGDMLLTGDMEAEAEAELLAAGSVPQSAVLKVAHHGKKGTSSDLFLSIVRPQWAVVSTDTNVEPNTPAARVVRQLWALKAGVAVTQTVTCGILVTLHDGVATAEEINYQ